MTSATVIVPTLNAAAYLEPLAQALHSQTLRPVEWIVVDSESVDGTGTLATELGAKVLPLERAAFRHGDARNRAAAAARSDILVFLSQDALPRDAEWLERLTRPLRAQVAASYARQVPRRGASRLEAYARDTNYPPESSTVTPDDVARLGVRAFFFSNASSAVRKDVFERLGGFSPSTIVNEDMLLAARMLQAGHAIAYAADATVIHSHALSPVRTFRRYYDIGVFFTQASEELPTTRLSGEGLRYVSGLLRYLVEARAWNEVPGALVESSAKWLGQYLGRRYRRTPNALRKRMSQQPAFWKDATR